MQKEELGARSAAGRSSHLSKANEVMRMRYLLIVCLTSLLLCTRGTFSQGLRPPDELVFVGDKGYLAVEEGIKYEGISEVALGQEQQMQTMVKQAFKIGGLRGGMDINISYDTRGQQDSTSKKNFLRIGFLEYNRPNLFLRYSPLSRATFGYGLLVNKYTTLDQGIYYAKLGPSSTNLQVLLTPTDLRIARFNTAIGNNVRLGITAVWDEDAEESLGMAKGGYALDLEVPLHKMGLYGCAEVAKLRNYGKGALVGLIFRKSGWEWQNQVLTYGKNFNPGYYDAYYEVSPANLNTPARHGIVSQLSKQFLQGRMLALASYRQNVGEMPSLTLQLSGQPRAKFGIVGTLNIKNYKWQGVETIKNSNSQVELKGIYRLNPVVDIVLAYNKSWFEDRGTRDKAEYFFIRAVFKSSSK